MNIRYKSKGVAVKFTSGDFDSLLEIPKLREHITERFGNLEDWKRDATVARQGCPVVRSADAAWYVIRPNQYFVTIDDCDLILEETEFVDMFEQIEEIV